MKAAPPAAPDQGGRIVVIDDSWTILEQIRVSLNAVGYEVRTTTGPDVAARLVKNADLTIVGASDEIGGYPKDRPVTPGEVAASVYHALGINGHHELPGPQGRPIPLVDFGVEPIRELF